MPRNTKTKYHIIWYPTGQHFHNIIGSIISFDWLGTENGPTEYDSGLCAEHEAKEIIREAAYYIGDSFIEESRAQPKFRIPYPMKLKYSCIY